VINEDELVRKRQQAREQLARDEENERLTRENNNNLTMKQVERVRSNSAKRDEIVAEKPKVNTPVVPLKVAAPVVKK
jgi:hypothetical protein